MQKNVQKYSLWATKNREKMHQSLFNTLFCDLKAPRNPFTSHRVKTMPQSEDPNVCTETTTTAATSAKAFTKVKNLIREHFTFLLSLIPLEIQWD